MCKKNCPCFLFDTLCLEQSRQEDRARSSSTFLSQSRASLQYLPDKKNMNRRLFAASESLMQERFLQFLDWNIPLSFSGAKEFLWNRSVSTSLILILKSSKPSLTFLFSSNLLPKQNTGTYCPRSASFLCRTFDQTVLLQPPYYPENLTNLFSTSLSITYYACCPFDHLFFSDLQTK